MTDTDTIARLTAELVEVRRENTMLHEANEGLGAACWTAQRELAAALAGAVEVRELEWVQNPVAEIWRCDTMIGTYKVFGVGPAPTWDFDGLSDIALARCAESVEAAKAAAQADYRARILAALHPSPDALQAVTAAAYEAAAGIPDGFVAAMDAAKGFPGSTNPDRVEDLRVIFATISEAIRALIPADAIAAQTRRDAQMRAEGMRAAAEWHQEVAQHDQGGIEYSGAVGIPISNMVELQQSVKMHQWSAEWLIALAAQTEEAANA